MRIRCRHASRYRSCYTLMGRVTGTWDTWGNLGFPWFCEVLVSPDA